MVQLGTILKVSDRTGVVLVKCIKVLGYSNKRIASMGDFILVSVQRVNPKRIERLKYRQQKHFRKGTMHRALLIRCKVNFKRDFGIYICFNENSVVLINRKFVPYSNRIYGPILREICKRNPTVGCIAQYII